MRRLFVAALLFAAGIVYFLLWIYTFQYERYYIHILPIVCVLGAAITAHSRAWKACLAAAVILQFFSTPVQFWNISERFPVRVALGLETREQFLDRLNGCEA